MLQVKLRARLFFKTTCYIVAILVLLHGSIVFNNTIARLTMHSNYKLVFEFAIVSVVYYSSDIQ